MVKNYTLNEENNLNILKDSLIAVGGCCLVCSGIYVGVVFAKNLIDYHADIL